MGEKVLSVIVPAYNMEALLPKCLGSMVVEDESIATRLEVIVVNDGSKDRTSEIAHEFRSRYPGVFSVIDKSNGNYGSCINVGLNAASGFYVRVLDADDYVETANFRKYLEFVIKEADESGADLIVTDYDRVDLNGTCLGVVDFGLQGFRRMTLCETLKDGCRYTIHSVTYKLENLKKIGYVQTEGISYTDTEWIIEPMVAVKSMVHLPIVVTHYLVGRDGQTTDDRVFAKKFEQIITIAKALISRYDRMIAIADTNSREYYRQQILGVLQMVYWVPTFGWNGHKAVANLHSFDGFLKDKQSLYQDAGEFTVHPRFLPEIKYVKLHRSVRLLDKVSLLLLKVHVRICDIIRSINV